MNNALLKSVIGATVVSAATIVAPAAFAGGLERAGYNIDLLFDPARFASEAAVTYVMPQRDLENVRDINPANGSLNTRPNSVSDTESYAVPRVGVKAAFGDAIDCMADYSQPWGAHTNPGLNWAGANFNIETKINSDNYAGTCSYKLQAGKGTFRVLGGVFYQEVDGFKERLVVGGIPAAFGTGIGRLNLGGEGVGWRFGGAYEIPEIAFRASLVYNSEVDLGDITGTLDLRQVPAAILPVGDPRRAIFGRVTNVSGNQSMPDSLEFKVQSGIAPGWLAFGSVKWVDWSTFQEISFCAIGATSCNVTNDLTSLELRYRDGWTVSTGVGHKFNDQWSAAASITWDRAPRPRSAPTAIPGRFPAVLPTRPTKRLSCASAAPSACSPADRRSTAKLPTITATILSARFRLRRRSSSKSFTNNEKSPLSSGLFCVWPFVCRLSLPVDL